MADLAGQHRNLASVMGVVGDQIADKSSDIRLRPLTRPSSFERAADDDAESISAWLPVPECLFRSDESRDSDCGGISSAFAAFFSHIARTSAYARRKWRRWCDPCRRAASPCPGRIRKIGDQDAVVSMRVVGVESVEQGVRGICFPVRLFNWRSDLVVCGRSASSTLQSNLAGI